MTILITGASGQDGHYLTRFCLERGARVIGVGRSGPDMKLNVADFDAVEKLIRHCKPQYIFHLAADSTISHDVMFSNHEVIGTGTMNILESCWRHCRSTRVFVPGSAVQFVNTGKPIDEDTPFEAASPYAAARIYTTYLARYFRSIGLGCYVGYLFHHDSPLRSPRHLSQKIAQGAARIAAGSQEKLTIGSLSVEKEWTFAGDTVRAMWMLVNQDEVWEIVIGSGLAYTVQTWVETCFQVVGIPWEHWIERIPGYRPDFQRLISNPMRLERLKWRPEVSLNELAAMMVGTQISKRL